MLGGISGYKGGTVDNIIQRVIEFILSLPTTPLWLGLAAAMPTNWPPLAIYLCHHHHSVADRLDEPRAGDTRPLSCRSAPRISSLPPGSTGRSEPRIIFRHMAPSFISHIIAEVSLAIPGNDPGRDRAELPRLGLAAAHGELGRTAAGGPEHPRDRHRALAVRARASPWLSPCLP